MPAYGVPTTTPVYGGYGGGGGGPGGPGGGGPGGRYMPPTQPPPVAYHSYAGR